MEKSQAVMEKRWKRQVLDVLEVAVSRGLKKSRKLKVGKLPGTDGIIAEVYQYGGEAVLDKLQDVFSNCWEKGSLPQDLRNAVIVSL